MLFSWDLFGKDHSHSFGGGDLHEVFMEQVPFTLQDEDISDDWECAQNIWDHEHNSCSIPQALSDKEIDEILASQVCVPAISIPSPIAFIYLLAGLQAEP